MCISTNLACGFTEGPEHACIFGGQDTAVGLERSRGLLQYAACCRFAEWWLLLL